MLAMLIWKMLAMLSYNNTLHVDQLFSNAYIIIKKKIM